MSCVLELLRSRSWPRAAVLALMTIGVAGCSGEVSRFTEGTYAPRNETTGSIPPAQTAPAGRVESSPLPPQAAPPDPSRAPPQAPASQAAAGALPPIVRPRLPRASPAQARARRVRARHSLPTSRDRWRRRSPRRAPIGAGTAAPRLPLRRATPSIPSRGATACRRLPSSNPTTLPHRGPFAPASNWSSRATATRRSRARRHPRSVRSSRRQVLRTQVPRTSPPRRPARPAIPACTWSRRATR